VKSVLEVGESPLPKAEKDITAECARELDVDEQTKLHNEWPDIG
jgi:hypothetical protein